MLQRLLVVILFLEPLHPAGVAEEKVWAALEAMVAPLMEMAAAVPVAIPITLALDIPQHITVPVALVMAQARRVDLETMVHHTAVAVAAQARLEILMGHQMAAMACRRL